MRVDHNGAPRGLWLALLGIAALTLIAEVFVHHHASFGVDGTYAFYAWYALAAAVAGIGVARVVAFLLARGEPRE